MKNLKQEIKEILEFYSLETGQDLINCIEEVKDLGVESGEAKAIVLKYFKLK